MSDDDYKRHLYATGRVNRTKKLVKRCILCGDKIPLGKEVKPGRARDWFHRRCFEQTQRSNDK